MANHNVSTNRQDGIKTYWFTWRCTCGRSSGGAFGRRFGSHKSARKDAANNGHR